MRKQYCYNCGIVGHVFTNCLRPVMSYGGILYQLRSDKPYYLLVQRTYTPDFKEIVRGKFDLDDEEYLKKLVSRITLQEINFIYTKRHQILYKNIQKFCKIKKNAQYYQKYKLAERNYNKLIHGHINSKGTYLRFNQIVEENNPSYYLEPDWGFPKGRRSHQGAETDMECAVREIREETGIGNESYEFKADYYVTEVYSGTNNIKYAHRYFLGKCQLGINCFIDPFNKHQAGEIRKMGWFSLEQTLAMIRPYHVEKKKVLLRVHREITGERIHIDLGVNKNEEVKSEIDKMKYVEDKL